LIEVSGYTEKELIGNPINLIRQSRNASPVSRKLVANDLIRQVDGLVKE